MSLPGSLLSSFAALEVKATSYSATELATPDQVGLYLGERYALFVPSRARYEHILDVLPKRLVLFEVDHSRRPASCLVGNELNSSHGIAGLARG